MGDINKNFKRKFWVGKCAEFCFEFKYFCIGDWPFQRHYRFEGDWFSRGFIFDDTVGE